MVDEEKVYREDERTDYHVNIGGRNRHILLDTEEIEAERRNHDGNPHVDGGALLDKFTGCEERGDGFLPEEWIASAVVALNENPSREREGVSRLESGEYFDKILEENRADMLGPSGKLRILVKFLDSGIRLPAQAHPDREFSRKHFNSEYGKSESWIVLGTRENANIFYGFRDGVSEKDFRAAITDSETDKSAMEKLMKSYSPKVADVFLVSAKTVHAIGYGCLILEIQEPTDFTVQPERWCGDYRLSDNEMFLGLSREDAISCFDISSDKGGLVAPKIICAKDGVTVESLINESHTPCFAVNRITLNNAEHLLNIKDSYGVYAVTRGEGFITGENYLRKISEGEYFFMPYSAMSRCKIRTDGELQIVECY